LLIIYGFATSLIPKGELLVTVRFGATHRQKIIVNALSFLLVTSTIVHILTWWSERKTKEKDVVVKMLL